MFEFVAVCCNVLQSVAVCGIVASYGEEERFVVVRCSVLQCVAVRCSALQCVAVCFSVLQHVAVCCSVLKYVLVRSRVCCDHL